MSFYQGQKQTHNCQFDCSSQPEKIVCLLGSIRNTC